MGRVMNENLGILFNIFDGPADDVGHANDHEGKMAGSGSVNRRRFGAGMKEQVACRRVGRAVGPE